MMARQVRDRNRRKRPVVCVAAGIAGALLLASGCSGISRPARDWIPFVENEKAAELPDRILSIWADTVLHQPGQPGVRGFGGRVYFYKEGSEEPIEIDGSLTVYAFRGGKARDLRASPDRKYIVTAEQMKSLGSKSSLGLSYSIWIPWDEVDGESLKLSLITRFDGKQGGTVISDPSVKLLPGTPTETPDEYPARQASHIEPDGDALASPGDAGTTIFSIDLPESFQRKLDYQPESEAPGPDIGDGEHDTATEVSDVLANWQKAFERQFGTGPVGWRDAPPDPNDPRADSPDQPATDSPEAHFAPNRFPARRVPRVQPRRDPLRMQPHPAGWPSGLPRTPRSGLPEPAPEPDPGWP